MDKKIVTFLKEWAVRYIKNKDLITRKIISLQEHEDSFTVKRADREQEFYIVPFITAAEKELAVIKNQTQPKAIFCFHTKENYAHLIKQWKFFVSFGRMMTVYFVNPFSKTERVLILSPYTHDMISDEESLEQGLKTMSESVEFTTEDEVKKIISS